MQPMQTKNVAMFIMLTGLIAVGCDSIVGGGSDDSAAQDINQITGVPSCSPLTAQPDFTIPPAHVHGAATIYAAQNWPSNGSVQSTRGDNFTNEQNALARAIRIAKSGDVIVLNGTFGNVDIGQCDAHDVENAFWARGPASSPCSVAEVIRDLTITSYDLANPATIQGILINGDMLTTNGGGIDGLYLKNLKINNGPSCGRAPITVSESTHHGRFGIYDIQFDPYPNCVTAGNFSGYGMQFNLRAHGRVSEMDARNINCGKALEHCIYVDSLGWNGVEKKSVFLNVRQDRFPTGRTFMQFVNRANEGVTGLGTIIIKDSHGWTQSGMPDGGGSSMTIAGFPGDVLIENYTYNGDLGGIVFWTVQSSGVHKNCNGFSSNRAVLKNIQINSPPSTNRAHVAIAGVESVEIHDFDINGPRETFSFNSDNGGAIANGKTCFFLPNPVSSYSGFGGSIKALNYNSTMSNAQIDALYCD